MSWNDDLIARLSALWPDPEMSCADIADILNEEFGTSFTRNAVIGKAVREKLGSKPTKYGYATNRAERAPRKKREPKFNFKSRRGFVEEAPAAPPIDFLPPLNIPFMQLEEFHCREIVQDKGDDGLAVFCGHQVKVGTSWCPWHHAQNFTKHITVSPEDRIKKHFQAIRNNRANSTGLRKYEIDGEEAA